MYSVAGNDHSQPHVPINMERPVSDCPLAHLLARFKWLMGAQPEDAAMHDNFVANCTAGTKRESHLSSALGTPDSYPISTRPLSLTSAAQAHSPIHHVGSASQFADGFGPRPLGTCTGRGRYGVDSNWFFPSPSRQPSLLNLISSIPGSRTPQNDMIRAYMVTRQRPWPAVNQWTIGRVRGPKHWCRRSDISSATRGNRHHQLFAGLA